MRSTLFCAAVSAALVVPGIAGAELTGNASLVSDYRFRGLSQTFQHPALQGGVDYAHSSGFYVGNWNSNVSSALYPNANLEMDFYGGFKRAFGDFGLDAGAIYYYYPGSMATLTGPRGGVCTDCRIDNTEVYVGGTWRWASLKYYHAVSDFFSVPDTRGSGYLDFTATFDVGGGWSALGHVGRQRVRNLDDADYTDWKLGMSKELAGWTLGAAYVDTNAKDAVYQLSDARKTMNLGRAGVVLSVGKTF
ncbi:MAG TPA: TorF family putative porin [Burkholderiales bacterium]|nr:TorF family putative porin [Burkholderiales bacterium]